MDDDHPIIEIRAGSPDNVWLVEMGDRHQWASFEKFVEVISSTSMTTDQLTLAYQSPSIGQVDFSWDADLKIEDESIPLHDYPRFDNPYCRADFDSQVYHIQKDDLAYTLDFERQPL